MGQSLTSGHCPSDSALQRLISGTVAVDRENAFSDHLETCRACRASLDRLIDDWTDLTSALQLNADHASHIVRTLLPRSKSQDPPSPRLRSVIIGFSDRVAAKIAPRSDRRRHRRFPAFTRLHCCASGLIGVSLIVFALSFTSRLESGSPDHESVPSHANSDQDRANSSQRPVWISHGDGSITATANLSTALRQAAADDLIRIDPREPISLSTVNRPATGTDRMLLVALDRSRNSAVLSAASNVTLRDLTILIKPAKRDTGEQHTESATRENPILITLDHGTLELINCRIISDAAVTILQAAKGSHVILTDCLIDCPSGILLHDAGGGVSLQLRNSRMQTEILVDIDQGRPHESADTLESSQPAVSNISAEHCVVGWRLSLVNLDGLPKSLGGLSGARSGQRLEWTRRTVDWSDRDSIYLPESQPATAAISAESNPDSGTESRTTAAWLTLRRRVPVNLRAQSLDDWQALLDPPATR